MYTALAWGMAGGTVLMTLGLLWLSWLESRDVARRKKAASPEISN